MGGLKTPAEMTAEIARLRAEVERLKRHMARAFDVLDIMAGEDMEMIGADAPSEIIVAYLAEVDLDDWPFARAALSDGGRTPLLRNGTAAPPPPPTRSRCPMTDTTPAGLAAARAIRDTQEASDG